MREPGTVRYETDSTGVAGGEARADTADVRDGGRRGASPQARVTFQYMSNEGELVTGQWQTITLYHYGDTQPTNGDTGGRPRYLVHRPDDNRSYVRKTVPAGWYLFGIDNQQDSHNLVQLLPGSDGLYCFNDRGHPGKSLFWGYYPTYGKVKFTFGRTVATRTQPAVSLKAEAFLTLAKGGVSLPFWLYNDRSTGSVTRSVLWYMPTGTYTASWYGVRLSGDADSREYPTKTAVVVVAPGKVYPNVRL